MQTLTSTVSDMNGMLNLYIGQFKLGNNLFESNNYRSEEKVAQHIYWINKSILPETSEIVATGDPSWETVIVVRSDPDVTRIKHSNSTPCSNASGHWMISSLPAYAVTKWSGLRAPQYAKKIWNVRIPL